jgi:hypothetical protein
VVAIVCAHSGVDSSASSASAVPKRVRAWVIADQSRVRADPCRHSLRNQGFSIA